MHPRLRKTAVFLISIAAFSLLPMAAMAANFDAAESLESQGLPITLAVIFWLGVLVSVTPCVYPMIPITLSIIGARSATSTPLVGFLRSLVFVLGIAVIYTVLGLIVAMSGGTVGFLLQSKVFLFVMAVFFIIMGLGMLGLFNLQLPPAVAAKLQGSGNRGGFFGAFLLGVTTGVVASPCGSPVLASVLTLAGASGRPVIGAFMLFTYALGIGLLFLVLGTFPSFLNKMPKSGGWMEDVKKFLGIVLIIASFYYLMLALPDMLVWGMLIATCIMFATIIGIKSRQHDGSRGQLWAWRLAGLSLLGVAAYAAFVPVPQLMAAEKTARTAGTASSQISTDASTPPEEWLSNEAAALDLARKSGWPVVVDLGAEWCAACKELEHITFPDPAVKEALKGFVKVRIDCTEDTPASQAAQKKYNSMSLPTVAFIDAKGNHLPELTLYEFEKPAAFVQRVQKVPAK